jgi:hypothetical protein
MAGSYNARHDLIEKTYSNETFILALHDCVELQKDWDEILINAILDEKKRSPLKNVAIVAPPIPVRAGIFGLFSNEEDFLPRYPVISGFTYAGLPLHSSKPFNKNVSDFNGIPSLLWNSSCSFCPANFFVNSTVAVSNTSVVGTSIPRRNIPNLFHEDTLITCDAMAAGWSFVCSPKLVARTYYEPNFGTIAARSGIPLQDISTSSKKVRDLLHAELGHYLVDIGLFKRATERAFSGIIDKDDMLEALAKS